MKIWEDTKKLVERMKLFDKKSGKYINFILWPKQVEFIDLLHDAKRIIILKKRQTGISQLTGADSLAQCMLSENFTVLILSKTGDDAKEYLTRVRDMYHSLDDEIKKSSPLKKDTQDELQFMNGSRMISLPANRGAGFTADRVIVDEAAFITKTDTKIDLETVLRRVGPTLDKAEGQLILISTANGMNLFRTYYINAVKKISNFKAFFFSCWDDPTFSEEKRERIIADHGEDHANQEYPMTWQEAFLSTGRPRFSIKILRDHYEPISKKHRPIAVGNIIDDIKGKQTVELNENGFITFYKKRDPRLNYIIAADISEGLENQDWTHAKVLELPSMEQVATYHGHVEPAEFGLVCARMGRHWNNAILVPEANNHGIAVISTLRHIEKYPDALIHQSKIKHREHEQDKYVKPEVRYGFQTTSNTKPVIIDNYAYMILNKDIGWIPEEDLPELYSYVTDASGRTNAQSGHNDDRVMTIAIGLYVAPKYIIAPLAEWKNCSNCRNWPRNRNGLAKDDGFCQRSMRWCSTDKGVCRLWTEFREIMEHDEDKYSRSGHRPLRN